MQEQFFKQMLEQTIADMFGALEVRLEEQTLSGIIDALIFSAEYKGQTPFAYFLRHASISPSERQLYESWQKHTRFSLFEVLRITIGKHLSVKDIINGKEYLVFEKLATYQLEPGMILASRIVPFAKNWVFTGAGLGAYPKDAAYVFKRTAREKNLAEISELEFVKYFQGKDADNRKSETSYEETLAKLKKELQKRKIDLSEEIIEQAAKDFANTPLENIYAKLQKGSADEDDFEYLTDLFMQVAQAYARDKNNADIGPRETMLIKTMIHEVHQAVITRDKTFDTLSKEEQQKRINTFTNHWMSTPQKELGGKTPKQIIDEERKQRDLPEARYRHTITPIGFPDSSAADFYNRAVALMKEYNYFDAISFFAQAAGQIHNMPEPFRFWGNAGGCLANLGEDLLAKKYFDKALKINPAYEIVRNNLATFEDLKKLRQLHMSSKKRLFEQVLKRGIMFKCDGKKQSPMLQDAIVFLNFINANKPSTTLIRRDLKLPDILVLNHEFQHPDPEEVSWYSGKKMQIVVYREEWQFPKAHFLHKLFLSSKYITYKGKSLTLTEKGDGFLSFPTEKQLGDLLSLWFVQFNWQELERRRRGMMETFSAKFNDPMIEVTQETIWQMLQNLKKYTDKNVDLKKLYENILPETDDQMFLVLSNIILDRIFLQYLVWSGIAKSKNALPVGKTFDINPLQPLRFPLRITPFGQCIVKTIEQAMHDAIPKILREIV